VGAFISPYEIVPFHFSGDPASSIRNEIPVPILITGAPRGFKQSLKGCFEAAEKRLTGKAKYTEAAEKPVWIPRQSPRSLGALLCPESELALIAPNLRRRFVTASAEAHSRVA
jgi:hypothetical protein